jgi:hypothetical protein
VVVMVVASMMPVMRGLSKRGGRYTENHDEEQCNLFHILIVDVIFTHTVART